MNGRLFKICSIALSQERFSSLDVFDLQYAKDPQIAPDNSKIVYVRTKMDIMKDSKRSSKQWAGRTDSNKWVIFDKKSERIGDIVPVKIKSAFGITLQGEIKKIQEMETVI